MVLKIKTKLRSKISNKIKLWGLVYIYQLIWTAWFQIPALRAQKTGTVCFPGEQICLCHLLVKREACLWPALSTGK